MFIHREVYTVATPRQADYERRVLGLHTRLAQEPASRGTMLLKFLGNASGYQAFRFWDTREAAQAWGRHPDMAAYLAARPPGNYLAPPQIDYWEDEHRFRAGKAGAPGFVVQELCTLAGGRLPDFEAWNRDLAAVCDALGGFVERRVFRFLGAPGRYLTVAVWAAQDAYEAAAASEELRALLESRPQMDHLSTAPVQEFFRVIEARET